MAGKAHGNGDRRGDNTICGLGDRLRRLTAGVLIHLKYEKNREDIGLFGIWRD